MRPISRRVSEANADQLRTEPPFSGRGVFKLSSRSTA